MYGIYLKERYIKSKKELKEYLTQDQTPSHLSAITLENTAFLTDGYSGPLSRAPKKVHGYTFVGPNPYEHRNFYGSLYWDPKKDLWKVK
jgi:hypothetical protein